MNGVIRELPPLLRDKIAAGEVVERPASVVKELVENSIDAGATAIKIEIENGGREYISVSDNGNGIEPEYIKTAFLPHATSKITSDDDLERILTKGFRGEALASIAAVSEVQVISKVVNSEYALSYSIIGGAQGEVVPAARDKGTTISVARLFYNTPARLKFLKKDVAEGNAVVDTITKIALAHPEIAFTLVRDGHQVLHCRAGGDRLLAINALVSKDVPRFLVPIFYSEEGYEINGYISKAEGARSTRAMQYLYVNGRYIKNKSFHAAIDQAVSGLFMHGKHPVVFVFLTLPTELVDVNVHPAKIEVRFAEERKVFSAIYRAVKAAFIIPETDHISEQLQVSSTNVSSQETFEKIVYNEAQSYESIAKSPVMSYNYSNSQTPRNIDIDIIEENKQNIVQQDLFTSNTLNTQQPEQETYIQLTADSLMQKIRLVGELFSTYIVLEIEENMVLMDKHAAHERIIYEQLIKQRNSEIDEQLLLIPITVEIDFELKTILLNESDYLKSVGIEIEDFGGNSLRIYSLPADIDNYDAEKLLAEIAEGLNTGNLTLDERTRWVYYSVACRSAMKAGDRITDTELFTLANDIYSGGMPACCPHGRPVIISLGRKELEQRFGRA